MQLNFTPEQESELCQIAVHKGTAVESLVQGLALRFLESQARNSEAVRQGINAADRGDFVDTAVLWAETEEVQNA